MSTISISETAEMRFLHFANEWIQGGMLLKQPHKLALEYSQQMMAWLLLPPFCHVIKALFADAAYPFKVLQLGLGSGALTKFCLHYLPSSKVCAVDISNEVVQVAHTFFALPRQHPRLQIMLADAWQYLQQSQAEVAIIQVDLYDASGAQPVYGDQAFYRDCAQRLHPDGFLVVNLFAKPEVAGEQRHHSFMRNIHGLEKNFATVWCLPPLPEGNVIALCSKKDFSNNAALVNDQAIAAREVMRHSGLDLTPLVGLLGTC